MYTKTNKGITLIALVITIVLNCSYLAMDRRKRKEKILNKEDTSGIIELCNLKLQILYKEVFLND